MKSNFPKKLTMKFLRLMLICVLLVATFAPAADAQKVRVPSDAMIEQGSRSVTDLATPDPCSLVTEHEISDILLEKYPVGRRYDIKAEPDSSRCFYSTNEGGLLSGAFSIHIWWTGGHAAMQREAAAPKSVQDRYGLRVAVPEPGVGDEALFGTDDSLAVRKGDVYFLIYADRPLAPRVTEPQVLAIARKVLSRLPTAPSSKYSDKITGPTSDKISLKAPLAVSAQDLDDLEGKGGPIANADPLALALRNQQPEGPGRRGFDIGMAAAEKDTLPGPGKERIHDALGAAAQGGAEAQAGFDRAVEFSLKRNREQQR